MEPLDPERLEEVSRATIAALDAMSEAAQRLAAKEVEGTSPDKRVTVRVDATGRIIQLRLRGGVLQRYDSTALSELVTRTIRDTQVKAKEAYERAVEALVPPEVADSERELERIHRE